MGKAAINKVVLHPNQAEIVLGDEAGYIRVLDLLKGTFTIDMVPVILLLSSLFIYLFLNYYCSAQKKMFRSLVWQFLMTENVSQW